VARIANNESHRPAFVGEGGEPLHQLVDWLSACGVATLAAVTLALVLFRIYQRAGRSTAFRGPDMIPLPNFNHDGTRDGIGAGDHDRPFRFGGRPRALSPYPFETMQYARLLLLRSRWQDGLINDDDATCSGGAPASMVCADRASTSR
jgi:hypothetical protein